MSILVRKLEDGSLRPPPRKNRPRQEGEPSYKAFGKMSPVYEAGRMREAGINTTGFRRALVEEETQLLCTNLARLMKCRSCAPCYFM